VSEIVECQYSPATAKMPKRRVNTAASPVCARAALGAGVVHVPSGFGQAGDAGRSQAVPARVQAVGRLVQDQHQRIAEQHLDQAVKVNSPSGPGSSGRVPTTASVLSGP
jgi:hypothetical protein